LFSDRRVLIRGFKLSGHSGFAQSGRDIVCAAVSGAAGLVECAESECLSSARKPGSTRKKPLSLLFRRLTQTGPNARIFEAFSRYMTSLTREYPKYIEISEVQLP
jgi:uncharacterized protein YsxB (DUF464 family)